jgi:NADPH:quinone reductase
MGERKEGDDIVGFVHKVGSKFTEFHPGATPSTRSALYTRLFTFPIKCLSRNAAILLTEMKAAVGLFVRLGLL